MQHTDNLEFEGQPASEAGSADVGAQEAAAAAEPGAGSYAGATPAVGTETVAGGEPEPDTGGDAAAGTEPVAGGDAAVGTEPVAGTDAAMETTPDTGGGAATETGPVAGADAATETAAEAGAGAGSDKAQAGAGEGSGDAAEAEAGDSETPEGDAKAEDSGDGAEFAVLFEKLDAMESSAAKAAVDIRELNKLYHSEFSGRLKAMQAELEHYHELEKGRMFDGILIEIAKLYNNNEFVVDEAADEKLKKQLSYLFQDMLQLLESNGVSVQKSAPGDKRNPRHCQVVERIAADDPEKHDTVAKSVNTGFYIENRTLIKEMVHVYLHSAAE